VTKDLYKPIIRRSTANQFLMAVALVGIVIFGVVSGINYYYNLFNGPFEMSENTLLGLESLQGLQEYFVTVEGDEAFDTGYQMVTKWNGLVETGHMNYGALLFDDQLLLYSTRSELGETPNPVVTGALTPIDTDAREVLEELYSELPELRGEFLPFMLEDDSSFQYMGIAGIGFEIASVLGAGLLTYRGVRFLQSPNNHPIMKSFQRYAHNSERAAQHLQQEMDTEHTKIGKLHLTRNWLAHVQYSNITAMLFKDVVWVYRKTTQHRTNGIPSGKTHAAIFYDRYGTCIEIKAKEKVVNEMLTAVAERSPFAFMGYDQNLERAWKSQRETIVQTVDQRRKQAQNV
jgi:hypothetical protein